MNLQEPILCLDHGFVRYIDHMGDDSAIVEAARNSYGKGTRPVSEDRILIRYLMRHDHGTPFEMCSLKVHMKLPIFVARQIIRHRTAKVNEYSARYSEIMDEFYVPEPDVVSGQSVRNKQGRGGGIGEEIITEFCRRTEQVGEAALDRYKYFNEAGLARELNRINTPVTNYTQWYWKCDLRNIFNFLRLRVDSHAQYETRVFANAIAEIVKHLWPVAYEAFEDYRLHAATFSRQEMEVLRRITVHPGKNNLDKLKPESMTNREWAEFCEKLGIENE